MSKFVSLTTVMP